MQKHPLILMDLYETEKDVLYKFMQSDKGDINNNYLILYNFATDLKYSTSIQKDLFMFLLESYLKVVPEALKRTNRVASQVYEEFNSSLYINKNNILKVINETEYTYIIDYYINILNIEMEKTGFGNLNWVSLFNTIVGLEENSIESILTNILQSSSKNKKASLFLYLSIILFPKKDNLFLTKIEDFYDKNSIWDFDSEANMCWSKKSVQQMERILNYSTIKQLVQQLENYLEGIIGNEETKLVCDSIVDICNNELFNNRFKEYLANMQDPNIYKYWKDSFI